MIPFAEAVKLLCARWYRKVVCCGTKTCSTCSYILHLELPKNITPGEVAGITIEGNDRILIII